jgi:hypothetical protein
MEKINYRFLGWFIGVAVVVFTVGVVLRGVDVVAPGRTGGGASGFVSGSSGKVIQGGATDDISVVAAGNGDEVVVNTTAGYYVTVPSDWYVEKSVGSGLTVYPDYDPERGELPDCKLEVSLDSRGSGNKEDLNAWVTRRLHADPTTDMSEISRVSSVVGFEPTSSAVEWRGDLNGVTTTLVYAAMPDDGRGGDTNVLEIAPSALSGAGLGSGDCDLDMQALVASLRFGHYEP